MLLNTEVYLLLKQIHFHCVAETYSKQNYKIVQNCKYMRLLNKTRKF